MLFIVFKNVHTHHQIPGYATDISRLYPLSSMYHLSVSVGLCGLLWEMFAQIDFFAYLCSLESRLSENQRCPIFQPRQPLLICINPRWPPNIPDIAYLSI